MSDVVLFSETLFEIAKERADYFIAYRESLSIRRFDENLLTAISATSADAPLMSRAWLRSSEIRRERKKTGA